MKKPTPPSKSPNPAEIVGQIDAVTRDGVTAMARRILTTTPSFAALGPIGRIDSYDRIVARLRA